MLQDSSGRVKTWKHGRNKVVLESASGMSGAVSSLVVSNKRPNLRNSGQKFKMVLREKRVERRQITAFKVFLANRLGLGGTTTPPNWAMFVVRWWLVPRISSSHRASKVLFADGPAVFAELVGNQVASPSRYGASECLSEGQRPWPPEDEHRSVQSPKCQSRLGCC